MGADENMSTVKGFHDNTSCTVKKIKFSSPRLQIQRTFIQHYNQNTGTVSVLQHVSYQTLHNVRNKNIYNQAQSNVLPIMSSNAPPNLEPSNTSGHLDSQRVEDILNEPKLTQRKKKSNRVRFQNEPPPEYFQKKPREFPEFIIWLIILALIVISIIGFFYLQAYMDRKGYCTPRLRNHDILEDVGGKLIGQYAAVENISNAFAYLNRSHLFVLTGMTGVGKSRLVRSVMMKFQWHENMHHLQAPFHLRGYLHDDIFGRLSKCGYNLIIIDGLKADHVYDLVPFVNKLFRAANNIVMLLVFNIHDRVADKNVDETQYYLQKTSRQLQNILRIPNVIEPETVIFRPMYEKDVRECVLRTMKDKDVDYNFQVVEKIMKHLAEDKSGCKRVDAKVAIAKENQKHESVWDLP